MSERLRLVSALYVEKGGVYWNLPGVDPWDESRDARKYAGPHPVVAHPPCQLWVNFAALNFKRYGGEHNRPGNDGGCFQLAVASVLKWGGVLEHPAGSNAWKAHGILAPGPELGWSRGVIDIDGHPAWACEVWQSAYGHPARKRTWLLYFSPVGRRPPELDRSRNPGTHQVGWFDRIKPTLSKKAASSTPPAFRDALLNLARWASPLNCDCEGGGCWPDDGFHCEAHCDHVDGLEASSIDTAARMNTHTKESANG